MKHILVIARHNHPEALRVAVGLTLLSDTVKIDIIGELEDSAAIAEQREVVEFAEIPYEVVGVNENEAANRIAEDVVAADVVFLL